MKQEGVVLLDSERGVVFTLNPIGALIWEGIERSGSRDDLARMLAERFPNVPSQRILGDLESFLNTLATKHLIEL